MFPLKEELSNKGGLDNHKMGIILRLGTNPKKNP